MKSKQVEKKETERLINLKKNTHTHTYKRTCGIKYVFKLNGIHGSYGCYGNKSMFLLL